MRVAVRYGCAPKSVRRARTRSAQGARSAPASNARVAPTTTSGKVLAMPEATPVAPASSPSSSVVSLPIRKSTSGATARTSRRYARSCELSLMPTHTPSAASAATVATGMVKRV